MGVKCSKYYSYYSQTQSRFQTWPNCPPDGPRQNSLEIFEPRFLTFFSRKFLIHHCIIWGNQKPHLGKMRNRREKYTRR